MLRLHFTRCDRPFVCAECRQEQPRDALLMIQWEKRPMNGQVARKRRELCEACGKETLESLEAVGTLA